MRGYTQLTQEERYQFYILKKPNIASDLETCIYFGHPYVSWECGLNENANGLIRQYFPIDWDVTSVTEREIKKAMDKLNHRPKKALD